MSFEMLSDLGIKKYEMCRDEPGRFLARSVVAGLYLGLATILSTTLGTLLFQNNLIASKIAVAGSFGIGLVIIVILGSELFIKGVLCNFIVCVGAYVGMKMQDDTAKTIIMMIVVMAFVLPGFEHSIANMGYFTLGVTELGTSFDWSSLPLHMFISTLGNIAGGGILLGLPLYLMIKPKK